MSGEQWRQTGRRGIVVRLLAAWSLPLLASRLSRLTSPFSLLTPHGSLLAQTPPPHFRKLAHTYSIVALDSATGDLGVAVQSKFPNVGALVPWAKAGVGAVAILKKHRT